MACRGRASSQLQSNPRKLGTKTVFCCANWDLFDARISNILSSLEFPGSIEDELPGLYDGSWRGSGDVITSFCPTTGEKLASIRTVRRILINVIVVTMPIQPSLGELKEALEKTQEASVFFRSMFSLQSLHSWANERFQMCLLHAEEKSLDKSGTLSPLRCAWYHVPTDLIRACSGKHSVPLFL